MRRAVKYHSPTTNVCIIRVARDHHRIAWGAVTLLTSIEGHKYIPNVVHVSGERNLVSRCTLVISETRFMQARLNMPSWRLLNTTEKLSLDIGHEQKRQVSSIDDELRRIFLILWGCLAAYQDSYEGFLQTSTLEIKALQD